MLIYVAILPMNELSMLKEIKTPNMLPCFWLLSGLRHSQNKMLHVVYICVNELFFVSIVVAVQTYSIHRAF